MGKWIDLPVDEMARWYGAGESTRALGRVYGVDNKTIWQRLVAAGVKMRPRAPLGNKHGLGGKGKLGQHKRGGPLHIDKRYLVTLDRDGKKCSVHRGCWEAHHGPIPEDWVVHHIDEDRMNNTIGNLGCMSHEEHARLHRLGHTGKEG